MATSFPPFKTPAACRHHSLAAGQTSVVKPSGKTSINSGGSSKRPRATLNPSFSGIFVQAKSPSFKLTPHSNHFFPAASQPNLCTGIASSNSLEKITPWTPEGGSAPQASNQRTPPLSPPKVLSWLCLRDAEGSRIQ